MASCVGGSHRRKVRIALAGVSIGVMAQAAAARDETADHAARPHASEVVRDSGEVQPSKPKAPRRPKLVAGAAPITPVDPRYVQLGAQRADAVTLDELRVEGQGQGRGVATGQPPSSGTVGQPPVPYAGGQVGSGTRVGFLGNRSVQKTPFNVTGYTGKLIEDQQARSVADVIQNNPSVRNDAPPYSERDSYFIRGYSVTNLDTAFDGLFYIANPRRSFTEGLERVEVLLGPTALLSGGTGRVGGTINLVPKRAFDEPLTRVTTSYFSDSQIGTHVDLGRRFGTFKEWGVRFNGAYRNGDTPLDKNAIEVSNLAVGLDYRGDQFRAALDLTRSTQNVTAPTSLFNSAAANTVIPRAPNNRRNTSNSFEYYDSRYNMLAGRVEYDLLPNTTIYAAGGVMRYNEDSLSSSYQITRPTGQATNTLSIAPTEIQGRSIEVGLRSEFQTGFIGHQLNVSAVESYNATFRGGSVAPRLPSYQTNIYDPVYLPFGSVPTIAFPRSGGQPIAADLTARSIAVADTLSLGGDRFLLTLGGRYQEIDQNGFVTLPGPTRGNPTSQYKEGKITPAIALVISPFDSLSFYGNYIEALVPGQAAPAVAINANEVFAPTVNRQKEIGAKYDFGTVSVTTSLFEIEQPSAFTDPTTRRFSVSGLQRNRGIEFNVFGEVIPGVRLLGGLTLIDAKLVNTARLANAARGQFDGNAAPGVPDVAFNLYGEYDLPPWLAPGLTLTGRAIYTSSMFYNQANTQSVPDWTRFDAGLRYTFEGVNGKPVVLRAIVENVLDDSYWASAASGFLAVGAPRTVILSASVDF